MSDARFIIRSDSKVSPETRERIANYLRGLHNGEQHSVLILEAGMGVSVQIVPFTDKAAANYHEWLCGVIENGGELVDNILLEGAGTLKVEK